MGMYSYFQDESINVLDAPMLAKWLESALAVADKRYGDYLDYLAVETKEGERKKDSVDFLELVSKIDNKDICLTFRNFDDMKIISYWYPEFSAFLRDIAVFVDGEVYWDFENHDEAGYVEFADGNAIIHFGHMSWNKVGVEDNIRSDANDFKFVQEDEVKQMKLLIRGL